jgi:hypothetical protein
MAGFGFGTRSGLHRLGQPSDEPRIVISASEIAENDQPGSIVGALSVLGASGAYAFSIPPGGDPDGKFVLSGPNLVTTSALDFETAASHQVTIEADNGESPGLSRTILISVSNVFEQPALGPLSLAPLVTQGAALAINGATDGSTLSAAILPTGWAVASGNREITIASDAPAGSQNWSLIETLADSENSPRISSGSTIVEAATPGTFEPSAAGYVIFDSREVGVDGSVSAWQSLDGQTTVTSGSIAEQPSKSLGVLSFDGAGNILSDTQRSLGPPTRSYNLDAVWNASTLGDADQFTNTGITRAPDGSWWVVNHPAGAPGRADGILVHFSADFSAVLGTIDLASIYGAGMVGGPQGLVYDSEDDTLWFTSALQNEVRNISLDGTPNPSKSIAFPNPAGLAIDPANGTLIILESEGSAANKSSGIMRTVSKTDGSTIASGQLTDMPDWDHIFFDPDSRTLFVTAGYEYSGGGETRIGIYNMDGGDYLQQIAYFREPGATAIEGFYLEDGTAWICNDSGFHGGLGSGLNEVLEYDVGPIFADKIVFAAALRVKGNSGFDAIIGSGHPLDDDTYGIAMLVGNSNALRIHARSSPTEIANVEFATGVPDLGAQTRIITAVFDPADANDCRMWVDGAELAGSIVTGADDVFTGPLVDRAPLALGGIIRQGAGSRHAQIDISAIGYGLFKSAADVQREEMEGWLAHEFGLAASLPANHPYKTIPPGG